MVQPELRELRWNNLRRLAENIRFGEILKVEINDGMPVRVQRSFGTVKLDDAREVDRALGRAR